MSTNVMSTSGSARPISFSAPHEETAVGLSFAEPGYWAANIPDSYGNSKSVFTGRAHCPYGVPGERLWVRETWTGTWHPTRQSDTNMHIAYAADGSEGWRQAPADYVLPKAAAKPGGWVTPLFMPRWASRITLEITEVRVQRLQEISVEDAEAEGLSCVTKDGSLCKYGIADLDGLPGNDDSGWPWHRWRTSPVDAYWQLWMDINGADSWNANPWVWALTFRAASTGDKPEEQSHV